eukprot:COSAG02_NODE_3925_length_6036_cov_4.614620_2_plen_1129_part_00
MPTAIRKDDGADYAPLDVSDEPELEPELEPEPEAVTFDMAGEDLELQITRKISEFMQKKTKEQGDTEAEEFAGAMAAIPGLQKRGGSTTLAKVSVKTDQNIDPEDVVTKANKILADSGDTVEVEALLLGGRPLERREGERWGDLGKHVKGEKGSRMLVLQARLASVDKQKVMHMLSMAKKDNQGERDLSGTSPAGTPNRAVDPLKGSVPVRAAFRLQKISSVDLAKRQFTATFYLELQWVEQRPEQRARAGSQFSSPLPRSASSANLTTTETSNTFKPKVVFENRVGDSRDGEWTIEERTCASAEQIQRFWAVDPEAVRVGDFTLFRALWSGSASFSIDDRDICDAPLDPVLLKIKIRCDYNTSKVVAQETMSGRQMLTVVAQEGHVSFIKVDAGQQYIDRSLMETTLNCEKGSFEMTKNVPTQYKIAEVAAKADLPSIDLCFKYKERLLPHRVSLVLPSALIGAVATASVWFTADEGDRALTNAILLVGAVLRISPAGRGGMNTLGTINLFLIGTVVFVSVLTVADLVKAKYGDTESVVKSVQIIQLACFGLWLIPALLLCFFRVSLNRFLRPPAPSGSGYKRLPESIINMTGSLLHTQWRKDRADSFNGELVPRWKTIKSTESEQWLSKFDTKEREQLKGIVYATAPIPEADQKEFLNQLQSHTDANRVPDARDLESADAMASSGGRTSPITKTRTYKHNMDMSIREVNEAVAQYLSEHPHDEPTKDVMHICDINNDFSVLPPCWKKDNMQMADEALEVCQKNPDMRDDELSAEVHRLWLERNKWAKDGPLGVDFDALPTVEQAKDLSVVMVSKLVLKTAKELEHDFRIMAADGNNTLAADELSDAMAVYGAGGSAHDSGAPETARAVDYENFLEGLLPEIEQQIAQELFSLGVNMVSVMEQINTQKRADSNAGSESEDHGWTGATYTDTSGLTIPVGKSGFHIFISYRRTGLAYARSVKQALEALGFKCFMDFEALNVGDFQENLERNLAGTPVVVVLLTPGSLSADARWPGGGRAPTDGTAAVDWLQREIQLALQMGKLIIPVRSSNFDIPVETRGVPKDDIGVLPTLNIIELNDDYFQASIDKIVTCIDSRANMSTYVGDERACDAPMPKSIGGGVDATAPTQ